MSALGDLLRDRRTQLGLTGREIAERAGIGTYQQLSTIELGKNKNPGIQICARIAWALALSGDKVLAAALRDAQSKEGSDE